jgi:hypothetical protein
MNYKEYLVGRLSRYRKGDIIISFHAVEQAIFRGIDLEEVSKIFWSQQDYLLQRNRKPKTIMKKNTTATLAIAEPSAIDMLL